MWRYHPEGNVAIHTLLVTGSLIEGFPDEPELHWAGLFHDLGKIDTTRWSEEKQRWTAYGHEKVSLRYIDDYGHFIPEEVNEECIRWLVKNHMRIKMMDRMKAAKQKALRDHFWFELLEALNDADDMVKLFNAPLVGLISNHYEQLGAEFVSPLMRS